jgi:class 3 adenylate cyclase
VQSCKKNFIAVLSKTAWFYYHFRIMPDLIKIEETVELPHPRAAAWPILARTDWINRAVGVPPVRYEVKPLPEGGSEITARAKILGQNLECRELPFEWTEPDFYQVRRIVRSGSIAEFVVGLRLKETASGCAVEIFAHFMPRNALGKFLAGKILGPKSMRDMRAMIQDVGNHLAGRQRAVMSKLPRTPPDEAVLEDGLKKLRGQIPAATSVEKLREFLTESSDVELSRIRPFTLARKWEADPWDVLKLFLHATRAGLFNLSWEVLCPNCRTAPMPRNASLTQLARAAHCDVCNIKFDAQFDKSVELKFSVHPSVRPCDEQVFCLIGPGAKPHIASQILLQPGERREWNLPAVKHSFRIVSPQVKESATLWSVQSALSAFDAEIVCAPVRFELRVAPPQDERKKVFVSNPNQFPVQLSLQESNWDDDILTAARVTNWQEFRDLFSREVISPDEDVTVGSQVVLFTDLRGSTAMYSSIGDAPAYALVRDHFKILHDVVTARHGSVVKTIGDAIMAVFSNLTEALAATREMHEQLSRVNSRENARLQLKSGLHAGSCLAVNANDKLDFFGTTINLAARLVGHCKGDDLVLADEIYRRAETQKFLEEIRQTGISGEEKFTGFPNPVKVWRIPVLKR